MGEVLTRAEIEAKYDGEWVLVGDPDWNEHDGVRSGTVLVHNKDRDEFHRQMLTLWPRPKFTASLYLGKMPERILLPIIP